MNPFSSRLVGPIFLSVALVASSVAAEKNPPGDIPDNQIFVKYTSDADGYSLKVPEGWARIENGADVSFTDKYNSVKVAVASAAARPTAKNVFESPLADLAKSGRAVKVKSVTEKKLPGGPVLLVKYDSDSEPNPVTNKILPLENEAYIFFKDGRLAILTVSAPRGADNVDQWKLMSESFAW